MSRRLVRRSLGEVGSSARTNEENLNWVRIKSDLQLSGIKKYLPNYI